MCKAAGLNSIDFLTTRLLRLIIRAAHKYNNSKNSEQSKFIYQLHGETGPSAPASSPKMAKYGKKDEATWLTLSCSKQSKHRVTNTHYCASLNSIVHQLVPVPLHHPPGPILLVPSVSINLWGRRTRSLREYLVSRVG